MTPEIHLAHQRAAAQLLADARAGALGNYPEPIRRYAQLLAKANDEIRHDTRLRFPRRFRIGRRRSPIIQVRCEANRARIYVDDRYFGTVFGSHHGIDLVQLASSVLRAAGAEPERARELAYDFAHDHQNTLALDGFSFTTDEIREWASNHE